jgi:hypothetical protein
MMTTVSGTFDAPASRMLPLMARVFRDRPYLLSLVGATGGHPLAGGTLRFALPSGTGLVGPGAFWGHLGARVREIDVVIESLGDRCQIHLSVLGRVSNGAVKELEAAIAAMARELQAEVLLAPI